MEFRQEPVEAETNYLDFNVSNFIGGTDDRSANHRWEDMSWEVTACIANFHKLHNRESMNKRQ